MKLEQTEQIISFYLGAGTDHMGRSLETIVRQDDCWLERTHDYIQWLFPLYVSSQFNPNAPTLTDEVREIFNTPFHQDYPVLHRNFATTIQRMLLFYGYCNSSLNPDQVEPTAEWRNKANNWLTPGNHNHLRITRTLRSMTLLGRQELARSFHERLLAAARVHSTMISKRTIAFWDKAVSTIPAD